MSFESDVLNRATARLRERKERNIAEYTHRKDTVYSRCPRIRTIDAQLRQTVSRAAIAALRQGVDPQPAIEELKHQNLSLQQEKSGLLAQMGYGPDYLKEQPVCPNCKDTGWIKSTMCDCLKQLCTEEQTKKLSSLLDLNGQSFQTFRLDYYGSSYSNDCKQMSMVLNACRQYADKFSSFAVKNLFLTGAPGLGKTFLSACIAREVTEKGYSVVYDTAINIFAQFEDARFLRSPEAAENTKRYLNCDLLILDDLGSELNTPFVHSALYNLINRRLVGGKHTVISTNFQLSQISSFYNPQTASRIAGEYQVLEFVGTDIRLKKQQYR